MKRGTPIPMVEEPCEVKVLYNNQNWLVLHKLPSEGLNGLIVYLKCEVQADFQEFLGEHRIKLLCFYDFEWRPFPFPDNI